MASRKLFLPRVPVNWTRARIHQLFQQYGLIDDVKRPINRDHATVKFRRVEDAVHAKGALDGQEVEANFNLVVTFSAPARVQPENYDAVEIAAGAAGGAAIAAEGIPGGSLQKNVDTQTEEWTPSTLNPHLQWHPAGELSEFDTSDESKGETKPNEEVAGNSWWWDLCCCMPWVRPSKH